MADNYLEKKMEQFKQHGAGQAVKGKGSLSALLQKNRSTRGFDSSFIVRDDQLRRIIGVNCKVASARNSQPLRFRAVASAEAYKVLPYIRMGSALSELNLPLPGTEPNAFIVVCSIVEPRPSTYIDLGISVQSMLLQAVEIGLNGLCIMSFDKEKIKESLDLPFEPLMVLALGKSAENISIVDIRDGESHEYYRADGVHYVPKVVLDDLIIK